MNAPVPQCVFTAITLFPEMFEALKNEGVVARGCAQNLLKIETLQLRDFATDERRSVDDHPVGGGDGMVLRADIAARALDSVLTPHSTLVHVTPTGKIFSNSLAKELAQKSHVVFLCGRYAGFDARLLEKYPAIDISLGDFVLSGGELPALCIIDAVARFVPGVLGNNSSALEDSFEDGLLEAPAYAKPLNFEDRLVPAVLLSGDHKKRDEYQRRTQIALTAKNRPDLLFRLWDKLSRAEKSLAEKIWKHCP